MLRDERIPEPALESSVLPILNEAQRELSRAVPNVVYSVDAMFRHLVEETAPQNAALPNAVSPYASPYSSNYANYQAYPAAQDAA